MQDLTKEELLKKVHALETERKVVNKLNRNKDFFHVSKKRHQSNFITVPLTRRL